MIGFVVFVLVVCLIAYVVNYVLAHHLGAPAVVINIVWAVAIILILLRLLQVTGVADVPMPRLR